MFVKQMILMALWAVFDVLAKSSKSDILYGKFTIEGPSIKLLKVAYDDVPVELTSLVWGKLIPPANDPAYTFEEFSLITRKPIGTTNYSATGNNTYHQNDDCEVTELAALNGQYSVAQQACAGGRSTEAFILYSIDVSDTQPITNAVRFIDGFSDVEIDYDNAKLKGSMVCTLE